MDQESLRQTISGAEQEMATQNSETELQNAIEVSRYLGSSAEVVVTKKADGRPRQATPNPGALSKTLEQQMIPKSKSVRNIK